MARTTPPTTLADLYARHQDASANIDEEKPYLAGFSSAVEFSSCTDLSLSPQWIADVNGYYRGLQVDPRASRKELGAGYRNVHGEDSIWLTYVLSQLLDDKVRREYDLMPLGSVYKDQFVTEAMNREEKRIASRLNEARAEYEMTDDEHDRIVEHIQEEIEKKYAPPEEENPFPVSAFPYNYYLWRSSADDGTVLEEWQRRLVTALSSRGFRTKLAVGFCGEISQSWLVEVVGYRTVVFLHEDALPTEHNASEAAKFIIINNTQMHRRNTNDKRVQPR